MLRVALAVRVVPRPQAVWAVPRQQAVRAVPRPQAVWAVPQQQAAVPAQEAEPAYLG